MRIEIYGPGCEKCRAVADNARVAAKELGIAADVVLIEDIEALLRLRALMTPALVVDGELKGSGRLFSVEAIKRMLPCVPGNHA